MKKLLKGLLTIISVICIAFSAFFVYSYATGNTAVITKIENGITKMASVSGINAKSQAGRQDTISMLSNDYGLSSKQAERVVEIAEELGVNTSNAVEVGTLIAKNAGHADEIRELAAAVQSGQISETQAKIQLAGILDV